MFCVCYEKKKRRKYLAILIFKGRMDKVCLYQNEKKLLFSCHLNLSLKL